ncbi:hypothetical protein ACKWTF_016377 [Chironomus riparius]
MKLLIFNFAANFLLVPIIASDILKLFQRLHQNKSDCMNDLLKLHSENSSIFNTWSTFTSSHKYGNSHDFGDFFGCNSISNTQYCLVQYFQDSNPPISVLPSSSYYQKLWTDLDVSFLGAVCLPFSCGLQDVREIFENFNEDRNLTLSDKIFCKTRKSEKFGIKLNKNNFSFLNWWNYKRIGILAFLVLSAIVFSLSGIEKLKIVNIIKNLFKNSHSSGSEGYMNGIKAISMILIVMGHTYGQLLLMPFKNGKNVHELDTKLVYQPLGMTAILMELFFIIGGILTARSLKKGMNGSNKIAWIVKFYIKRFTRLVPVTIFYIILLTSSDTDTMAPYNVGMDEGTRKLIWFMPFIYNFLNAKMTYSSLIWFVSVYLQLSMMAPFVLLFIRMKKYENIVSGCSLVVLSIIRYLYSSNGLVEGVLATTNAGIYIDDLHRKYIATVYRLLPFFGGMIIEKYLSDKMAVNMMTLYILSFIMLISIIALVITGALLPFVKLIAAADVFIIIFIFLIFYLIHHNDWTFKKFLSHKFWEPISKMGLTIYLITSYFLFTIHEREVEPIEVKNELEFLLMFLTDVLKTAVPILVTFVFVEEPWSRLGDLCANNLFN